MHWKTVCIAAIPFLLTFATAGAQQPQQQACPPAAITAGARGWDAYRRNDIPGARAAFSESQRLCPNGTDASVGLAYVDIRSGALSSAKQRLTKILAGSPDNIDALTARGIIAWRDGDTASVKRIFEHVRKLDPANEDARTYLARLPQEDIAPQRAPLQLPETTQIWSRTNGDHFETRSTSGWTPFYIKGMNLGAALPGKNPSEFPDSSTYAKWIGQIAAMGVNVIRVYTIHPPRFYDALAAYNATHAKAPLWLIHGVWAELPPQGDFDNAPWRRDFLTETRHVVDLLHGRADINTRPGHASGHYTADVSPWVLAYVTGREWEPFAIEQFNKKSTRHDWHGKYLDMPRGTAADAWMAEASDYLIAYEMKTYNAQRPVAYTNWPTLDPLTHNTETTVAQELAIRRARGETITERPKEYDNDHFSLDATLVHATSAFEAGWFASYHAYPYYPDFMNYDTAYADARSSVGPSRYFGYLKALKAHHPNMPVVISEYGVPASIGIAHFQQQGWNHGGQTEEVMAQTDARLTREIAEAGMAGGIVFAWIDEWFKKNWIVIDHEIPLDRNRLWYNRMDAEQHYGMIAMDATPAVSGATLKERLPDWKRVKPLYDDGATVRITSDAAYLWLLYTPGKGDKPKEINLGLDVLDPVRGDSRWPGRVGDPLSVGLEFVLIARGDTVRILADSAANPWRITPVVSSAVNKRPALQMPDSAMGFFAGRSEMRLNHAAGTRANADGAYAPLIVIPNRRRFTRDSTEVLAVGYDRGILRQGESPDGLWERLDDGTLEVRIPWMLINVTDPSQRRVLDDRAPHALTDLGTSLVDGIRIVARVTDISGEVRTWPRSAERTAVAKYSWPTWEEPSWRARTRSVYETMRDAFATLQPMVIH